MKLHKLLSKIDNNERVNFEQVQKCLPSQYKWSDIFRAELISKNAYKVEIINRPVFDELLLLSAQTNSRSAAAAHPLLDSHQAKCDSLYKLVFPHFENGKASELAVFSMLDNMPLPQQYVPASSIVLIENQDCFFRHQQFLGLFKKQLPTTPFDIMLSAGKQILDSRVACELNKYQRVYCLFDYDYFGLSMFTHLQTSLHATTQYLLPDELAKLAYLFTFKANSTTEYLSATRLAEKLELSQLADVFKRTKHYMEQEALLSV